jgi:hypothetical protein
MDYKGEEAEVFGVRAVDDAQIIQTMNTLGNLGYPALTMIHTENMEIVYRFKDIANGWVILGSPPMTQRAHILPKRRICAAHLFC